MNIKKGDYISADIGEGLPWVRYESDGDVENYYRDVYDEKTGVLVYSDGELLKVEEVDKEKGKVALYNENIGNERSSIFEISMEQFQTDFKKALR